MSQARPFSFMRRLKEIDLFFAGRSPQHHALRRLSRRLRKARIPYAIVGAMAVNLHGAHHTTDDVDVLLTPRGLDDFRQAFVGKCYDPVEGRARRFKEGRSGVMIDCLLTGHFPGREKSGPIVFPDPDEASEEIEEIRVVTLPHLVELKLAAHRYYDLGDVVFLIRVHDLDEAFQGQLHPSVHHDFLECLEEKRRDDEFEARE